jgi:hypothetical protein
VVVLLHGGVKSDEKFSCVCLRSRECRMIFFSSGNVISHSVSNFQGGVFGLVLYGSVVSLCDSDFWGALAILFFCGPVRTLTIPLQIYS